MNLVPAFIGTKLGSSSLQLQKASPTVLFGVGIAGVTIGTVLACRATLRMHDIVEESAERVQGVHEFEKLNATYEVNDREHDLTLIRVQTVIKIAKVYAPAIIVTGVGIACLTHSHRILTSRNAALTAAYTTLDRAFNKYRSRVVDKYGEQQDQEFLYETEKVAITEGKKTKEVTRIGPGGGSVYARWFDQRCPSWSPEHEHNLLFLKCQQNYFNDMLRHRGHVFLNEVYDRLGYKRTKAGSVVGWRLTKDDTTINYVSLGVFEGQTDNARDFVNGRDGAILLDFNVDGLMYDTIEEEDEVIIWPPL